MTTTIAYWRAKRRLTLTELASRSGVSARQIAAIERGENKPRLVTVLRLCEALDVPDTTDLTSSFGKK